MSFNTSNIKIGAVKLKVATKVNIEIGVKIIVITIAFSYIAVSITNIIKGAILLYCLIKSINL